MIFGKKSHIAPGSSLVTDWMPGRILKGVQRYQFGIGAGSAVGTQTITAVDMNRTIIQLVGHSASTGASTGWDSLSVRVELTNSTTITATRIGTTLTITLNVEVWEFYDRAIRGPVQRGTISCNHVVTTNASATINSVDLTRAICPWSGFSHTDTSTPLQPSADMILLRISNATTVLVEGIQALNPAGTSVTPYQIVELK